MTPQLSGLAMWHLEISLQNSISIFSFVHFTWHHLCQLRKACSADMCNNAEGATKCGEGLPLIEDILES